MKYFLTILLVSGFLSACTIPDEDDPLTGNLVHIGFDDQGEDAYNVCGDGNFIYPANGEGGLHVYDVE